MPALDFPSSPTNGQVYGQYTYDSTKGAWRVTANPAATVVSSPTAPSSPVAGNLWLNTNDGVLFVYYNDGDTSQWVEVKSNTASGSTVAARVDALEAKPNGLVAITPSSVAVGSGTATVGSNGVVTFSGATSISLNNCFSNTYRNYRVVMTFAAFSAQPTDMAYRLRSAGTDLTAGTNYAGGHSVNQSGTVSVEYTSAGAAMWCGKGAANYPNVTGLSTDINQPFVAGTSTTFATTGSIFDGSQTKGMYFGGVNATAGSYDGLTLIIYTGNASGTMTVYGYR